MVLDNVSDPAAVVGDAQIDWLAKDLAPLSKEQPIVVFTHRPLFDLYPQWDWTTKDGAKAIDVLQHYKYAWDPAHPRRGLGFREIDSLDREIWKLKEDGV
jgi:hypothetical protein